MNYATKCIQPRKDYFEEKFDATNGELGTVLCAFKAARLFSPSKNHEMKPNSDVVDDLKALPFLIDQLANLKIKLPVYLAASLQMVYLVRVRLMS